MGIFPWPTWLGAPAAWIVLGNAGGKGQAAQERALRDATLTPVA